MQPHCLERHQALSHLASTQASEHSCHLLQEAFLILPFCSSLLPASPYSEVGHFSIISPTGENSFGIPTHITVPGTQQVLAEGLLGGCVKVGSGQHRVQDTVMKRGKDGWVGFLPL